MVILLVLRNPKFTCSTTAWIYARGSMEECQRRKLQPGTVLSLNPCSTVDLVSGLTRLHIPRSLAPQPSLAPHLYLSQGCWNSLDT